MLLKSLEKKLLLQQQKNRWRPYRLLNSEIISFASNDYLSLRHDEQLKNAMKQAINQYGIGHGCSPAVMSSKPQKIFEDNMAEYFGQQDAILFANGYQANLALLATLSQEDIVIFHDKQNHGSLYDSNRLITAKFKRYPHLDLEQLPFVLSQEKNQRSVVVSESIFSVDGAITDLKKLLNITQSEQATLTIDHSHGIGIIDSDYKKISDNHQVITIAGLGKSFACFGGIVIGNKIFIDYLRQFARQYLLSTALPDHIPATLIQILKTIQQQSWRREKLQENIGYFKKLDTEKIFHPSFSQIHALFFNAVETGILLQHYLLDRGIYVSLFRPPAITQGSCIRVTLNCDHSQQQIAYLQQLIQEFLHDPITDS